MGRLRERLMPAYLVRTIDEHDLVGFSVAEEMEDLTIAVDECLDLVSILNFQPAA
jgi:hypothetical protein